jgi:hypothetical protein
MRAKNVAEIKVLGAILVNCRGRGERVKGLTPDELFENPA